MYRYGTENYWEFSRRHFYFSQSTPVPAGDLPLGCMSRLRSTKADPYPGVLIEVPIYRTGGEAFPVLPVAVSASKYPTAKSTRMGTNIHHQCPPLPSTPAPAPTVPPALDPVESVRLAGRMPYHPSLTSDTASHPSSASAVSQCRQSAAAQPCHPALRQSDFYMGIGWLGCNWTANVWYWRSMCIRWRLGECDSIGSDQSMPVHEIDIWSTRHQNVANGKTEEREFLPREQMRWMQNPGVA